MRKNRYQIYILGGVKKPDPDALAFYKRGIDDGAISPCGFKEINDTIKLLKAANPNFMSLGKSLIVPHWMVKEAAGTGATAGNRAVSKLYNFFGASGDQTQTTASAQYLLLKHTGENYAYNSGVTGNGFSTPNNTNNDLSGNFAIETKINLTDLNTLQYLDSKYNSSVTQQYSFMISSNTLILRMYNGTEFTVTSASIASFAGTTWWARVSRNSTTGVVKFFTSTNGTTFTQLGTDQTSVTGLLSVPGIDRRIAAFRSTFMNAVSGQIFYSNIYKDDLFTTVTQSFNPADYNPSVSQTTFQRGLLETYTIVNDANTNGLKAFICYKTVVMLNGSSMGMQASGLAFDIDKITHVAVIKKFNNSVTSIHGAIGNNAGGAAGYYLALNEGSNNTEGVGCYASVFNGRNYTSNSTLAKIVTGYADTALNNPETDYYVNNVQASPVSQTGTGNNTSNIVATGYNLGASNNAGSLWSNEVIYADYICNGIMDASTRLAVYNIFKNYFSL